MRGQAYTDMHTGIHLAMERYDTLRCSSSAEGLVLQRRGAWEAGEQKHNGNLNPALLNSLSTDPRANMQLIAAYTSFDSFDVANASQCGFDSGVKSPSRGCAHAQL